MHGATPIYLVDTPMLDTLGEPQKNVNEGKYICGLHRAYR